MIVGLLGGAMWLRDAGRRRSGLVAPPVGLTIAKIASLAIAGIVVVAICNVNRGQLPADRRRAVGRTARPRWSSASGRSCSSGPSSAGTCTPWAATPRRPGGPASTWPASGRSAFVLCSLTAGLAGVIYLSQLGGMTTNINGGQLVLYAVAAAVIGGTSLFGGRGRAIHGLLGGLVIGAIYNGLYLLGLPIQWQLIATGAGPARGGHGRFPVTTWIRHGEPGARLTLAATPDGRPTWVIQGGAMRSMPMFGMIGVMGDAGRPK